MKKLMYLSAGLCLACFVAGSALAGKDLAGNGFPTGRHYNLNIIGVPMDKDVPTMTGSNRHTIFVPLNSGEDVGRQVTLTYVTDPEDSESFRVLDGNATDDNEAVIQVPYEYCIDLDAGCEELLSFEVYVRALGKPGPDTGAVVTADCAYELSVLDPDGTGEVTCAETLRMGSFEVKRPKKKPTTENITDIFRADGCLDIAGETGICDSGDLEFRNMWIFNIPFLQSYMWDYDNDGLKLLQVRFYETTSGYIGYVE